jgi:hypothetical protein
VTRRSSGEGQYFRVTGDQPSIAMSWVTDGIVSDLGQHVFEGVHEVGGPGGAPGGVEVPVSIAVRAFVGID